MVELTRSRWALCIGLIVLAFSASCSRQSTENNSSAQASNSGIPFHQDASASDTSGATPNVPESAPDKSQPGGGLPFDSNRAHELPAGTLLTVRLQTALSNAKLDADGTFSAFIDEPILIDGKTIVARGTSVLGRIESASASDVKRDTGYLRLTLDSITVQGKPLHLQTSSLFTRGNVHPGMASKSTDDSPRIIDLQKDRRLTFRLIDAVTVLG
jgi:hypothetical protein